MAKINFGGVVQDARGKQNGLVYSKNKSGAYVRRKVTPVNPASSRQATVRAAFGLYSRQWSGYLNDSQREQWIAFANLYPITDIFGNSVTLNGLNMYVRLNAALANSGATSIDIPPATVYTAPVPLDMTSFVAQSGAGLVTIDQTAAAATGTTKIQILATPSMPAGRTSVKSDYRYITTITPATTGFPATLDFTAAYRAKFGAPIAGNRINILASSIDTAIGIPTVGQPASAIVS